MTLPGFKSRCTRPRACVDASASAIWRAIAIASPAGGGRRSGSRASRLRVLHDQVVDVVIAADVVDPAHMRMFDMRHRLGLAHESRAAIVVDPPRHDLDGDGSVQAAVVGAIDLAHAAPAERRDDLVRPEAHAFGEPHVARRAREPQQRPDLRWSETGVAHKRASTSCSSWSMSSPAPMSLAISSRSSERNCRAAVSVRLRAIFSSNPNGSPTSRHDGGRSGSAM